MPLYQIDIEKYTQGPGFANNFWTNVYYCEAADLAAAAAVMTTIKDIERNVHTTIINFTKARVRLKQVGSTGTIISLAQFGLRVNADHLPLFNVFRIDLNTGVGRPSRKYLRGPVLEGDQLSAVLSGTVVTLLQNSYLTPLLGVAALRDVDGEPFVSGAVITNVGMRQLRRGSKRRNQPVI